jgi:trehalose/maltose transport system permease protein
MTTTRLREPASERWRRRAAWGFLAPALLLLAAVAGWPLLRTAGFAFTDAYLARLGEARWIGWENFRDLVVDPDWWRAVANTLVFTACSVSLQLALGLAFALVLHRAFPGRGLLRALVLVPWAIPTVVSARMWHWMAHDVYGVGNDLLLRLGWIGAPVAWLASDVSAMAVVIVADVWKATPFMALLLLAGLQSIPRELYEAARVDGVSRLAAFRHITWPLLQPAILVALVFRTLDALRVFDLVYVLTSNSPSTATMSVYARQQMIDFQEVGYGSAVSLCIFLVIALVTAAYLTTMRATFAGER